jgi:hypothetical protein
MTFGNLFLHSAEKRKFCLFLLGCQTRLHNICWPILVHGQRDYFGLVGGKCLWHALLRVSLSAMHL